MRQNQIIDHYEENQENVIAGRDGDGGGIDLGVFSQ